MMVLENIDEIKFAAKKRYPWWFQTKNFVEIPNKYNLVAVILEAF